MRLRHTITAAVLAGASIVGISSIGHAEEPDRAESTADFGAQATTRAFWIHNLSTKKLDISSVSNMVTDGYPAHDNNELPAVGTSIGPGETMRIELDDGGAQGNRVRFELDVNNDNGAGFGYITLFMDVDAFNVRRSNWMAKGGPMQWEFESQDIYMFEPTGDIDVSSLSSDEVGDFVSSMCDQDDFSCSFQLTGERAEARSEARQIGETIQNATSHAIEEEQEVTDRRTLENAWGVEMSVGVKGAFSAGLKVKYSGKFVESHEFKKSTRFTIQPGEQGWIESTVPVYRYTGNYTIVSKSSPSRKWTIRNVTVDSPHPEGFPAKDGKPSIYQVVRFVTGPMTSAAAAQQDAAGDESIVEVAPATEATEAAVSDEAPSDTRPSLVDSSESSSSTDQPTGSASDG
jgi:hypothetical protein